MIIVTEKKNYFKDRPRKLICEKQVSKGEQTPCEKEGTIR